jgi:hypothetical protein
MPDELHLRIGVDAIPERFEPGELGKCGHAIWSSRWALSGRADAEMYHKRRCKNLLLGKAVLPTAQVALDAAMDDEHPPTSSSPLDDVDRQLGRQQPNLSTRPYVDPARQAAPASGKTDAPRRAALVGKALTEC